MPSHALTWTKIFSFVCLPAMEKPPMMASRSSANFAKAFTALSKQPDFGSKFFVKFYLTMAGVSSNLTPAFTFAHLRAKFGTEYIGIYVDDIIHVAPNHRAHTTFHKYCEKFFPTTTQGELKWILGMQVKRDRSTRTLTLDQSQAIITFLESCGMRNSTTLPTPMEAQWKYGDDTQIVSPELHSDYRSKVGSLSYFAQCTRPDIAYAVNVLCRHLHIPNKQCIKALNHLIQYLAGTPNLQYLSGKLFFFDF